MMDDSCAKFGDFSFSRFCFIVRTVDRHTESQTESQTPLNAILTRMSSAKVIMGLP